jgi:hypothetical protein
MAVGKAGVRCAFRLFPLVIYPAVVAWLTWPLAAVIDTLLPGIHRPLDCDRHLSAWAMAWSSRALVEGPWAIADANIYHPAENTLFYGQAGLGALPYFMPAFLSTGNPVLALNLTLVGGLVVTACLFHLVVRHWTGSSLAGFAAGATFLSNRFVLGYVPTAPYLAALQFLPIIALLASRRHERMRDALLLVPLVVVQCLTDPVHVSAGVLGVLGVLAGARMLTPGGRAAGLRLGVALLASLVLLLPVYAGYARTMASEPDLREQTVWKNPTVPVQSPTYLVGQHGAHTVAPITIALVGAAVVSLALRRGRSQAGAPPPQAWVAGALWYGVGCLLALGPWFSIAGHTIATPLHHLVQAVPSIGVLRVPHRAGYAALTGTSLLAGLAVGEIVRRIRAASRNTLPGYVGACLIGGLVVLVAAGLYFDAGAGNEPPATWSVYAPPPAPPALVEALRADPGPVLEIPAGFEQERLSPRLHAEAMFRSIAHRQPILNGYSSYFPAGFPELMTLAASLPGEDALAQLRTRSGLRWIWLHAYRLQARQRDAWNAALAADPPSVRTVARAGGEWLLEVVR